MEDRKFNSHINDALESEEPVERAAGVIAWGLDRVALALFDLVELARKSGREEDGQDGG